MALWFRPPADTTRQARPRTSPRQLPPRHRRWSASPRASWASVSSSRAGPTVEILDLRPDVPRALRARCGLPLRELRRLARLVQAGLLALDLAGVPRQVALALEEDAKVRVDLDERPRDAVANRAGLARRAAAVHADAQVVLALELGDLERRQDRLPVQEPREVVLEHLAVDPRLAVAG